MTTDIDHLSFSQINEFIGCSQQYYFHRITELEPMDVSSGLVVGSAYHAAIASFYDFMKKGSELDLSGMMQVFEQCLLEDEAKQMNPNAADLATETNCTVFVMQALRRLGGGGVVDLSQEAVERHIRRVGVAEATAREAATTWLRLWGSFLAQPQPQVDGGFRRQLQPVLQPILGIMLQRAAGAAGGGASSSGAAAAAQPGAFGRKRKHAGS